MGDYLPEGAVREWGIILPEGAVREWGITSHRGL